MKKLTGILLIVLIPVILLFTIIKIDNKIIKEAEVIEPVQPVSIVEVETEESNDPYEYALYKVFGKEEVEKVKRSSPDLDSYWVVSHLIITKHLDPAKTLANLEQLYQKRLEYLLGQDN